MMSAKALGSSSLYVARRSVLALPLVTGLLAQQSFRVSAAAARVTPSREQAVRCLGFYQGAGCGGIGKLDGLASWLGRRPQRHLDFLSHESWPEMVSASARGSRCWQPAKLAMCISVPMLPRQGGATLANGARGDYDQHFTQVAQNFVRYELGNAVVRIGWEFNHDWYPWRADRDPAAWSEYWRRIVTAMRAVPGANFEFDWCTGWGKGKVAPDAVYPGDEFVDVIGMDCYNTTWNPTTPEQRWRLKMDAPFGLGWQRAFATERGKRISIPEWATGLRPDGRGGGDDPYYVEKMADWLSTSDVAYHHYWDYRSPDFHGRLSDGSKPQAEAVFLKFFGKAG